MHIFRARNRHQLRKLSSCLALLGAMLHAGCSAKELDDFLRNDCHTKCHDLDFSYRKGTTYQGCFSDCEKGNILTGWLVTATFALIPSKSDTDTTPVPRGEQRDVESQTSASRPGVKILSGDPTAGSALPERLDVSYVIASDRPDQDVWVRITYDIRSSDAQCTVHQSSDWESLPPGRWKAGAEISKGKRSCSFSAKYTIEVAYEKDGPDRGVDTYPAN